MSAFLQNTRPGLQGAARQPVSRQPLPHATSPLPACEDDSVHARVSGHASRRRRCQVHAGGHSSSSDRSPGHRVLWSRRSSHTTTQPASLASTSVQPFHETAQYLQGRCELEALPIVTLQRTKLPTESVLLEVADPRLRLLFKLVKRCRQRQFGVLAVDKETGERDAVGCVCELSHFIPVPEKGRLFVKAVALRRFRVQSVVDEKPFLMAAVREVKDEPHEAASDSETAASAAAEATVWEQLLHIRQLARKLRGSQDNNYGEGIITSQLRRYCPDRSLLDDDADTCTVGQPGVMEGVQKLMGAMPRRAPFAECSSSTGTVPGAIPYTATGVAAEEYLTSDLVQDAQLQQRKRQELFSFAAASAIQDLSECERRSILQSVSALSRLQVAEQAFHQHRAYLAARSALQDVF